MMKKKRNIIIIGLVTFLSIVVAIILLIKPNDNFEILPNTRRRNSSYGMLSAYCNDNVYYYNDSSQSINILTNPDFQLSVTNVAYITCNSSNLYIYNGSNDILIFDLHDYTIQNTIDTDYISSVYTTENTLITIYENQVLEVYDINNDYSNIELDFETLVTYSDTYRHEVAEIDNHIIYRSVHDKSSTSYGVIKIFNLETQTNIDNTYPIMSNHFFRILSFTDKDNFIMQYDGKIITYEEGDIKESYDLDSGLTTYLINHYVDDSTLYFLSNIRDYEVGTKKLILSNSILVYNNTEVTAFLFDKETIIHFDEEYIITYDYQTIRKYSSADLNTVIETYEYLIPEDKDLYVEYTGNYVIIYEIFDKFSYNEKYQLLEVLQFD